MKSLLVLIFCAFCMSSGVVSQCNNADDYTALRALYLSTDGDNWTDNTGWPDALTFMANPTPQSGTDMSMWYGIVCQEFRGGPTDKVNYVEIEDNNLIGSIPNEIGGMSILKSLRLNDNSISGDLSSLSTLNLMNTLDLSRTGVAGNISALSTTQTNIILLADTDVVGDLSSLYPLGGLDNVDLENTYVVGDIVLFHGMSALLTLNLNDTNVSGDISSLQNTPSLLEVNLNNTGVIGDISNIVLTDRIHTLELENLNLSGCWSSYFKSKCGALFAYNFEGNQGVISNQGWLGLCDSGVGQCSTNCPVNISRTCLNRFGCELIGGTYEAVDSVNYSGPYSVSQGVAVMLNGGKGVELSNGFQVLQGGLLQIEVEGCMQK